MRFFLWLANRTPEARQFIIGWTKTISFDLDGKVFFYLRFQEGKASFHDGRPEKYDVLLRAPIGVMTGVLAGRIEMDQAFAEKQFEVVGPIVDGVKFRHFSAIVEESHSRMFSLLRGMMNIF